MQLGKNPVAVV